MSKCRGFKNDAEKISLYIHGYFLVWLDLQRKLGKLKKGTLMKLLIISLQSRICNGKIDMVNNANTLVRLTRTTNCVAMASMSLI